MHYHQTTYPSSPQLTYDMTTDYNKTDRHSPTTGKLTGHNSRKTQSRLSLRPPYPPIYIHTANRIFTNITLMADKHNIPKGKMHSNCRLLPEDIVYKMTQSNNIRNANTCDPVLKLLNKEITSDMANIVPIPKPNKDTNIQAHIPPLSNCKDTGEEPSSLHNSKHAKHTHAARVQNTTLYSDGTTHTK